MRIATTATLFALSTLLTITVAQAGNKVLTDPNGMTLYTFDSDDVGQSNCYADCAQSWKPFLVSKGDKKRNLGGQLALGGSHMIVLFMSNT